MAFEKCQAAIAAAAGRDLTERELAELFREIDARARGIRNAVGDPRLQAADELAADVTLAVMLEKRAAAINAQRFIEAKDYLDSTWADRRVDGIESMIVGGERARAGGRFSVAAESHAITGEYLAGFTQDVVDLGDQHMALLASGSMDREIAQALEAIENDAVKAFKGPKEAAEIAAVIHKWQELARVRLNRAGAWIGKVAGYITRQSHDQGKVLRAGRDRWIADVRGRLDIVRTVGSENPKDIDDFLGHVWEDLSSGVHLRQHDAPDGKMAGFKGFGNLAKRASQSRVLHFRDADAWFDYNAVYGTGNLRESVIRGLERSAMSTALMRTFGTNPAAMVDRLVRDQQMSLRGDPEASDRLKNRAKAIDNRLAEVDGRTRIPVNALWARRAASIRMWENTAKLGGAVLTSMTDIATYGAEMKHQGLTFLSGMGEALGALAQGRPDGEKREILSALGVFFESMRGEIISRFSADDSFPGTMSRMQGLFFKMNGLSWWTETLKASAALGMAHRLGLAVDTGWGELNAKLRNVLGLFGLDAGKWDILRSTGATLADGRHYLTPDGLKDLPDDAFGAYLRERGQEPTTARVNRLRDEIATQYRAYITDRIEYAVLTPDARTRAFMRQGSQPGTGTGEFLRFVGQFKAFPIAFAQKIIGRELLGRGADTLTDGLRHGHGEVQALAQTMLWMTLFGYGAMSAKDMLRGKEARNPAEWSTIRAAFLQGGGLGIYGDFIFAQTTKYGRSFIETAAGPTLSTVGDIHELWQKWSSGDAAAAETVRVAMANAPFLNLFYTRAALDYAILYRVQEWLSPGYLRRMEQRIKRENQQQFIVSPQEAVR